MKPKPDKIEEKRLRALLKVRERQFQIAVAALKHIVQFQSAHLSVFLTEVHQLQRQATEALVRMEEAQRGKKGQPVMSALYAKKVVLNNLYGKFGEPKVRVSDDD